MAAAAAVPDARDQTAALAVGGAGVPLSAAEPPAPAQPPALAAEQTAAEHPAAEPPAAEQQAAEPHAAEQQPPAEQPAAESPAAEQPDAEPPAAEPAAEQQPAAEPPAAEQPAAEQTAPATGPPANAASESEPAVTGAAEEELSQSTSEAALTAAVADGDCNTAQVAVSGALDQAAALATPDAAELPLSAEPPSAAEPLPAAEPPAAAPTAEGGSRRGGQPPSDSTPRTAFKRPSKALRRKPSGGAAEQPAPAAAGPAGTEFSETTSEAPTDTAAPAATAAGDDMATAAAASGADAELWADLTGEADTAAAKQAPRPSRRAGVVPACSGDVGMLCFRLSRKYPNMTRVAFVDAELYAAAESSQTEGHTKLDAVREQGQIVFKCCSDDSDAYRASRRALIARGLIEEDSELFLWPCGNGQPLTELIPETVSLRSLCHSEGVGKNFLYLAYATSADEATRQQKERKALAEMLVRVFDDRGYGKLTLRQVLQIQDCLDIAPEGQAPPAVPPPEVEADDDAEERTMGVKDLSAILERAGPLKTDEACSRLRSLTHERAGSGLLIFVRTVQGLVPVDVGPDATVAHVQAILAADLGGRAARSFLSFGGTVLWDAGELLSDIGVCSESTLELLPKKPSFVDAPVEVRLQQATKLRRATAGDCVPVVLVPAEDLKVDTRRRRCDRTMMIGTLRRRIAARSARRNRRLALFLQGSDEPVPDTQILGWLYDDLTPRCAAQGASV
eukprot:TRINITY_DN4429_c0_g1_i2.p1 TRINITY_DN4429_c0_g1~~TRINITY_DN4429_c0_g1_i2.p1  ORF type:complete len:750 (+),score=175.89 TRINITY_DN4429_c0_g1_i2:48-2252(+)